LCVGFSSNLCIAVFYTGGGVDGNARLSLSGRLSSNFVAQYSTNRSGANWIILLSLPSLPYSPYLFLDPDGGDEPVRFYRAFMQ
jgi:hypothetical protein